MPLTAAVSNPDLFTAATGGVVASAPPADWVPGIAAMAHRQAYDLCEMPLGTAVRAVAVGQPIVLLPVVLLRRTPHLSLLRRRDNPLTPHALRGRRIGVRSYTQTTGAWIRAVLEEQAGLAPDDVQWVTADGEPFAEQLPTPTFVTRAAGGGPVLQQLRDGLLDAVVASDVPADDPDLTYVFEPVAEAAREWLASAASPIGHLLVANRGTVRDQPEVLADVLAALYRHATGRTEWAAGDELMRTLPVADCFDPAAIRSSVTAFATRCIRQGILHGPLDLGAAMWDPATAQAERG